MPEGSLAARIPREVAGSDAASKGNGHDLAAERARGELLPVQDALAALQKRWPRPRNQSAGT